MNSSSIPGDLWPKRSMLKIRIYNKISKFLWAISREVSQLEHAHTITCINILMSNRERLKRDINRMLAVGERSIKRLTSLAVLTLWRTQKMWYLNAL